MRTRGRKRWVPPSVLDEVFEVRREEKMNRDVDAFKKMAEYSKIGREFKKMRDRFIMYDVFGNKIK